MVRCTEPVSRLLADAHAALLEHLQHAEIVRQHVGDESRDPGLARKRYKMSQQARADAPVLPGVSDDECDFGLAGRDDDIARTADDHGAAALLNRRHQRDMPLESRYRRNRRFLRLRKASLWTKEAAVERARAEAADRRDEFVPVLRPERADRDRASVTQLLAR